MLGSICDEIRREVRTRFVTKPEMELVKTRGLTNVKGNG